MKKRLMILSLLIVSFMIVIIGGVSADYSDGIVFEDDFETGLNNWDTEGSGATTTPDSHSGNLAALLDGDATDPNERIINVNVDTSNFQDILFSYWVKTENFGGSDKLNIKYTLNGNDWNDAEPSITTNIADYTQRTIDLSALDINVENNPSFGIKFALKDVDDETHTAKIDDVLVEGIETVAPEISGLNSNPIVPKYDAQVTICVNVEDDSNIVEDEVRLTCETDDEEKFSGWIMEPTGNENEFCRVIPAESFDAKDGAQVSCSVDAEDEHGNEGSLPLDYLFTFDGENPIASFTINPNPVNEGSEITFDGSGSSDSVTTDPNNLIYNWDFGDGTELSGSDDVNPSHTYEDNGVYTVTLTVEDEARYESDPVTLNVTVNNVAPQVNGLSDVDGEEGSSISIDPITFIDEGSKDTHELTIDWDDGTTETFSNVESPISSKTHTYNNEGTYTVTITVKDNDNGEGQTTLTADIGNVAPSIDDILVNPEEIYEEETTTLSATVSDVGADDTNLSYTINWGDESANTQGSTSDGTISETHQYMDDDNYTITLIVSDGEDISNETVDIVVKNSDPDVDAGENIVTYVGEEVQFTGTATDVEEDIQELSYSWDFGDGNSGSGTTDSNIYSSKGTYTVTLTVTDEDGGSSTDTLTVTVYDYKLSFESGWNTFSIPLVPEDDDTSINSVLPEEVYSKADKIWSYQNGEWIWNKPYANQPGWWASANLQNIVPGYGYYIKMEEEQDAELYKNGNLIYGNSDEDDNWVLPKPPEVTLATNSWNLVGTYGLDALTLNNALESLTGAEQGTVYYDIVYDDGGNYVSGFSPTEAYWVSVKLVPGADSIQYKAAYQEQQVQV